MKINKPKVEKIIGISIVAVFLLLIGFSILYAIWSGDIFSIGSSSRYHDYQFGNYDE